MEKNKIICRFDSKEDIEELKKVLVNISESVSEYDLDRNLPTKIVNNITMKGMKREKDVNKTKEHYVGMPEFLNKQVDAFHKITFHTEKDPKELSEIFDQNISNRTKSIWYPKLKEGEYTYYRVVGGNTLNKYPIYIVSKGRSELCTTSVFLSQMEVPHYVVVEPDEVSIYNKTLDTNYATVLELDMSYKDNYDVFSDLGQTNSTGPGAARNFCWEHSMKNGHKWHWVMDDNASEGFFWYYQNNKIKCRSGAFFRAIEDFVDRYDNIAISGLNYAKFCVQGDKHPPFVMNTRIYSFLLIRNDIPYRWRGRYNEDTDLSLRVLKDGWCTVQFNSLLAGKITTQRIKGGNTDEFYDVEGTLNKSQMLKDMHPDVTEVVWKFSRWHHHVDYSGYKQQLKLKEGIELCDLPKVDNYGMKIIRTDSKIHGDTKSGLEEKYKDVLEQHEQPTFYEYEKKSKNALF